MLQWLETSCRAKNTAVDISYIGDGLKGMVVSSCLGLGPVCKPIGCQLCRGTNVDSTPLSSKDSSPKRGLTILQELMTPFLKHTSEVSHSRFNKIFQVKLTSEYLNNSH